MACTSRPRSTPARRERTVSAVARRSRCSRIWPSRPSSPVSNSILPPSTSTAVSRSTDRATASSSPCDGRAVQRGGGDGLGAGDREPGRDAGALVDRAGLAQRAGEPGEDLDEVVGYVGHEVGLLADHRDLVLELDRVVRADLGAEPVLERRDDAAAVGVVLGVGAGHHEGVQRQPQHVAADLDVALLHHVEHRDLDPLGEVGQLVDRDDSPVGAGNQAEVDRLGVTEAAALGHLHRVHVTDQVGDAGVGRGQLLGVPLVAVAPLDPEVLALLDGAALRLVGDRLVGVLPQLGAGDHRRPLVEQPDQGAQQPGLALAALAQQDHVVAGQDAPARAAG